jgi:hypothetical protein
MKNSVFWCHRPEDGIFHIHHCANPTFHIHGFSYRLCNLLMYGKWGKRWNTLFCITGSACIAKSIPGILSAFADCGTALAADCYELSRYENQNVTP